jgi:hypothetical protein
MKSRRFISDLLGAEVLGAGFGVVSDACLSWVIADAYRCGFVVPGAGGP